MSRMNSLNEVVVPDDGRTLIGRNEVVIQVQLQTEVVNPSPTVYIQRELTLHPPYIYRGS